MQLAAIGWAPQPLPPPVLALLCSCRCSIHVTRIAADLHHRRHCRHDKRPFCCRPRDRGSSRERRLRSSAASTLPRARSHPRLWQRRPQQHLSMLRGRVSLQMQAASRCRCPLHRCHRHPSANQLCSHQQRPEREQCQSSSPSSAKVSRSPCSHESARATVRDARLDRLARARKRERVQQGPFPKLE